jgi:ankyrin repeat protein
VDAVRLLLQHGANVNGWYQGFFEDGPLGRAIKLGNTAAMEVLLQAGAHADGTALVLAVKQEQIDGMQLLLDHGVQDKDDTALVLAASPADLVGGCYLNRWGFVRLLLRSGAPLTSCRAHVALAVAALSANQELVQDLLQFLGEQEPARMCSTDDMNSIISATLEAGDMAMQWQCRDGNSIQFVHPQLQWVAQISITPQGNYCGIIKMLLGYRETIMQHRRAHARLATALIQAVSKGRWALLAGTALLSLRRFVR